MESFDKNRTIGSIITEFPETIKLFKDYNIDLSLSSLLPDAIADKGVNEKEFLQKLSALQKDRGSSYRDAEKMAGNMSPASLSAYIEDIHHSYLRIALPQTAGILQTVLRTHGKNHHELFELYKVFGQLRSELEQHLIKEEILLYPALLNGDDKTPALIVQIREEHDISKEFLLKMRQITDHYTLPPDACGNYRLAFQMLMHMESDLYQHIHLENDILVPKYERRV